MTAIASPPASPPPPPPPPAHTGTVVVAGPRLRRVLLWVGSAVTVVALLLVGFRLLAQVAYDQYVVTEAIDATQLAGVNQVRVSNTAGSITVVASDITDASVTLDVVDGLFAADRSVAIRSGELRVDTSCDVWFATHCRVDQRVAMPASLPLDVRGRHGHVRIEGASAPLRVDGRFGDLVVEGAAGPVSIDHGFGRVTAAGLGGAEVDVTLRFGESRLEFAVTPSDVRVDSRFGSTTIEVPDDGTVYRITGTTSFGDRSIQVRTDPDSSNVIHVDSTFGEVTVRYTR